MPVSCLPLYILCAFSSALSLQRYAKALKASLSEFPACQLLTVDYLSAKHRDMYVRRTAATERSEYGGLAKGEHNDYPQVKTVTSSLPSFTTPAFATVLRPVPLPLPSLRRSDSSSET